MPTTKIRHRQVSTPVPFPNRESHRILLAHQNQSPRAAFSAGPARFTVKFAGAGAVSKTQPVLAGYERYAECLRTEDNGPSEWSPFSSQLDWEVARWAKLRGPGSTALSELLQINGVSRLVSILLPRSNCALASFQMLLASRFQAQRNSTKLSTTNYRVDFHSLFGRKSRSRGKNLSFTTVTSSNVSGSSTVTQNLRNSWCMPPKSAILVPTRSAECSQR